MATDEKPLRWGDGNRMRPVARPAQHARASEEAPELDPYAVDRAYRLHRARRQARLDRQQARRNAHLRFFVVILVLVGLSGFIALTVWREIEQLFGL